MEKRKLKIFTFRLIFLQKFSKEMIQDEYNEIKKQAQIAQAKAAEELRLKKISVDKKQAALPASKDPIYNASRKEMLKFAANFHFQMRVHCNLYMSILNKDHKEDLRVKVEGLDFAVCNPVGPINVKLSLMLRKLSLDTYFRGNEITKGAITDRKKMGIFGSIGTTEPAHRMSTMTQGYGGQQGLLGDIGKTMTGEQIFNILSYRKLIFNVDFDTQVDLNDHIVNIVHVSGNTGAFLVNVSTILTKKIHSLQETLVPKKDPYRELRAERRAMKIKMNMARAANTFMKGSNLNMILLNGDKIQRKIYMFSNLGPQDVEQALINSLQDIGITKTRTTNRHMTRTKWNYQPEVNKRIQEEYLRWHRKKYEGVDAQLVKSRMIEDATIENKLRKLSTQLQNIVLKVGVKFDPLVLQFLDDSGKTVSNVEMDVGKLEVKIDEIYTKSHYLKCMGLAVQSKDSLMILSLLVNVSSYCIEFILISSEIRKSFWRSDCYDSNRSRC